MSDPVLWLAAVLLVSAVGTPFVLWWERRRPSSYSRRPEVLAAWRALPTEVQEAHDNAVLDAAQAAENAATRQARINTLYRP